MGYWVQFLSLDTALGVSLIVYAALFVQFQQIAPKTKVVVENEYDYIIVGGGSAGSAVAARLSEKECVSVLLLEAGGLPNKLDNVPILSRFRLYSDIDWAYSTVPQKDTGNGLTDRKVVWPSGKGLGGSSTLNAMMYVRGAHENYNEWKRMGAEGWGWEDVFPYFLKLEDYRDPEFLNSEYHATGGPVTVEKPRNHNRSRDLMFQAGMEMGYELRDVNGEKMTGFFNLTANMRDGERCSTSKAYLVPAEDRENLDIKINALVSKIIIENKRAVGVEYKTGLQTLQVRARKEVIVSAGTVNTAQLLMLSGIGPKEDLKKFKIDLKADLPVGKFMQDHVTVPMVYALPLDTTPLSLYNIANEYITNKTGVAATCELIDGAAFINTNRSAHPDVDLPNLALYFGNFNTLFAKYEFGFSSETYKQVLEPYEKKSTYLCFVTLTQPFSSGTVKLSSGNIRDPPLIDPKYLKHEQDVKDMVEGIKICTDLVTSKPMRDEFGAKFLDTRYPGCEDKFGNDNEYYKCLARSVIITVSHQVGTAKMGKPSDPTTVVDPQLRVKGIEALRVVDASVMPKVPSGNTNIPTIMIGEKASDMIKKNITCNGKKYKKKSLLKKSVEYYVPGVASILPSFPIIGRIYNSL